MRSESGDFYYAQLSGAGFRFLRHSSSSMGPGAKINRPKTVSFCIKIIRFY